MSLFLVPVVASLAIAHAADSSKATRLVLLGTQGGPRPTADRAEPANLLIVNGVNYLIDAGNGVAGQLAKVGVAPADIRDIFITHNHDDHNADWGTLMGLAWSVSSNRPMTVYGPAGTEMMRRGFLTYFAPNAAARYLEGSKQNMPVGKFIRAHDYKGSGVVFKDQNIRVTALENCHFHFPKGSPGFAWQHSYSLRFETPDRVIVFSGDTGPCGDVIPTIAKGADILVHEVIDMSAIQSQIDRQVKTGQIPSDQSAGLLNHMRTEHSPPEEVGRVAKAAGVKLLVLSHLVIGNDPHAEQVLLDGIRKAYAGPVVIGHDLQEF
jgi:ribonuclease BN (tRNA processing enzyme)